MFQVLIPCWGIYSSFHNGVFVHHFEMGLANWIGFPNSNILISNSHFSWVPEEDDESRECRDENVWSFLLAFGAKFWGTGLEALENLGIPFSFSPDMYGRAISEQATL